MSKKRQFAVSLSKEGHNDEAAELLKSAMLEGDINAINDYAVIQEKKGNYDGATSLYNLAGILGMPTAIVNLGNLYEYGKGVDQSYVVARLLYQRATKLKDPLGYFKLSELYFYGRGVTKDPSKALVILKKGYEIEKPISDRYECAIQLACAYDFGHFNEPADKDKALEYYSVAASKGCPVAYYNAGYIYSGNGDIDKALDCWMKAGNMGYGDAYSSLFFVYWNGDRHIKPDHLLAVSFLNKGLELNSFRAMLFHADLMLCGDLGEINKELAIRDIATYLCDCPHKDDYQDIYDQIKEGYIDQIDWEAIENNPRKYLEDNNNDIDC